VTKPTLVAIYARVSTGEQNPEAQLLALREYAARRGFSIPRACPEVCWIRRSRVVLT